MEALVCCCMIGVANFFSSTQVGNLAAPVEEWTVGGTALTSLMDVERRHGNVLAFTLLSTKDFWTMFRHSFAVYSSSKQYAKSCYPLLGWLVSYFLTILHAASFFWHCSLQSGKFKPVIKKAMVELDGKNTSIAVTDCYVWFVPFIFFKWFIVTPISGAPFKKFASMRDEWAIKNRYISPGT